MNDQFGQVELKPYNKTQSWAVCHSFGKCHSCSQWQNSFQHVYIVCRFPGICLHVDQCLDEYFYNILKSFFRWSQAYFVIWWFLSVVICANLLIALVLEVKQNLNEPFLTIENSVLYYCHIFSLFRYFNRELSFLYQVCKSESFTTVFFQAFFTQYERNQTQRRRKTRRKFAATEEVLKLP